MDLFKGVKDFNRKGDRKEWWLNVEKITRLFEFFEKGETKDQEGKEMFAASLQGKAVPLVGTFSLLLSCQWRKYGRHRQTTI